MKRRESAGARRLAFLLGLTLTASLTAAEPQSVWRRPEAPFRLLAGPATGRAHLLRVDVPETCRTGVRAACAYLWGGTAVAASPVLVGEELAAVEVSVPRRVAAEYEQAVLQDPAAARLPVEVYLLPGPDSPLPLPPAERTPISVSRALQRLVTRPYLGRDLLLLEAKHKAVTYSLDVAEFAATLPYEKWNTPPEHLSARLTWSTDLRLAEPVTLRFGADRDTVAWFLFLDGGFVAGWKEGERQADGARLCAPQDLLPGFHRLDLFAVQQGEEAIPRLVWQPAGQACAPIPPDRLCSPHVATAIRVERKDGILLPGLRIATPVQYLLPRTEGTLLTFGVQDLTANQFNRKVVRRVLRVEGRELPAPTRGPIAVAGLHLPPIEFSVADELGYEETIRLPGRFAWFPMEAAEPCLELTAVPVCLAVGQPLVVGFRTSGLPPGLLAAVRGQHVVAWTQFDANAGPLAADTVPVGDAAVATGLIRMAVHPEAASVQIVYAVPGLCPLAPLQTVRLLRPHDSFAGLRASGDRLLLGEDAAVALPEPMARLAWAPAADRPAAGAAPNTAAAERPGLLIADDFWAVAAGPDASLRPEECLARDTGLTVAHADTEDRRLAGAAPAVRKFAILADVQRQAPRFVLWAVGAADLRAGVEAEPLCRDLLFLAQASAALGARPVLVALPPLPGLSRLRVREAALLVKELAVDLQTPVVDAYSRSKLDGEPAGEFEASFVAGDGTTGLRTPNDRGRTWLCRTVADTLRDPAVGGAAAAGLTPEPRPAPTQPPAPEPAAPKPTGAGQP